MWRWPGSGSKRGAARGRSPKLCCSPERQPVGATQSRFELPRALTIRNGEASCAFAGVMRASLSGAPEPIR